MQSLTTFSKTVENPLPKSLNPPTNTAANMKIGIAGQRKMAICRLRSGQQTGKRRIINCKNSILLRERTWLSYAKVSTHWSRWGSSWKKRIFWPSMKSSKTAQLSTQMHLVVSYTTSISHHWFSQVQTGRDGGSLREVLSSTMISITWQSLLS